MQFAQHYDLIFSTFDLPDCLRRTNEVLFDPAIDLNSHLIGDVAAKLKEFVVKNKIENLVIQRPFGPKQHIDHRIVWIAGQRVQKEIKSVVIYYVDDIPYSVVDNEDDLIAKFHLGQDELSKKHTAMEIYKSQMCNYFHDRVDELAASNNNYERLFKFQSVDNFGY